MILHGGDMLKAILFDMDGTLLPMDAEAFTKAYMGSLAKKFAPHGYAPEEMIDAVWRGVAAMVKNDGTSINEEVFWATASARLGARVNADREKFDDFYRNDFDALKAACGFDPAAGAAVNPALVDVTTGGNLNSGEGLVQNHLYMATMTDHYITAGGSTVKVLVRGGYSLS